MKKAAFRLTALVLALALCLLPAAAGAVYVDRTELEFIVGEPADEWIEIVAETGEEFGYSLDVSGLGGNGLRASGRWNTTSFARVEIWGTPKAVGEYDASFEIGVCYPDAPGVWIPVTLFIHFIVRAKETPVAPAVPTVVDNVIYNAAPEHEQALIRGVREWCNVRAGAGTNSDVIGRANLGQQISLLRWNADESWCFVEFNGLQGWIAKQFILPIK